MQMKFIVLGMLFTVFISGCGSENSEPSQAAKEASYINFNQERIKGKLKDPESVQFRNAFVSNAIGAPVVCGEVNAKNSFGGYMGFQRFVSGGSIQVVETDMAAGEMDKTWAQVCKR